MNITLHPLLADAVGYGEAMNTLYFVAACGLAPLAMMLAFLTRRWRAMKWVSLGSTLVSTYFVIELVRLNSPQWQPDAVLATPVLFSVLAVWWSSQVQRKGPKT